MPEEKSIFEKIMDLGSEIKPKETQKSTPPPDPLDMERSFQQSSPINYGTIIPDASQQVINQVAANMPLNVQNSTNPNPIPPKEQRRDDNQANLQKPQGDSSYVGSGLNHVLRNWDIGEALNRSFDTYNQTEAKNHYLDGTNLKQVGYSARELDFSSVVPTSLKGMSQNDLMGISERLTNHNVLLGLQNDKGDALKLSDLSKDGNVVKVLSDNYGKLQRDGIMHLDAKDAAVLSKSSDALWNKAYDPLSKTITLDKQQMSILDNFDRYKTQHNEYRDFVKKQLDNISSKQKWDKLSVVEKQQTKTFFNTLEAANDRYGDAYKKLASLDTQRKTQAALYKKGKASLSDLRDANDKFKQARDNFRNVRNEAGKAFEKNAEEGRSGHQGRVDATARGIQHVLAKGNESGADFTATELRGNMMKARGAMMTAQMAVGAGKEAVLKSAEKKLEKAHKKGKDKETVDRLQRRVDDLKDLRRREAALKKAENGADTEALKKAREDLTRAKDVYRVDKREAKEFAKDKRFERREGRRGSSKSQINGELQNRRLRRNTKNVKADKRHETRRKAEEITTAPINKLKTARVSLREKIKNSKFGKAIGKSKFGTLIRKTGKVTGILRGGLIGVLKKLLVVLLPVLLIILIIFFVAILIVGAFFALFEMFIGDDGDKESQTDAIEWDTANYLILTGSLRNHETKWQDEVNEEAKKAGEAAQDEIKAKLEEAGITLYPEFPLDMHKGETGVMLDEYDRPKPSMGNYIQNIAMAKYRVNTDLKGLDHGLDSNLGVVSEYIAYLWSGTPESDSDNWSGRAWYELEKDQVNNRGTDINGDEKAVGITPSYDENLRWTGEYTYQNWDPAAIHWIGENHKVRETPYSTTYQGENAGTDATGVVLQELGGDVWFKENPEVAIHYWHHDDISHCDHPCYHGDGGHDMGTSPDGNCDNYVAVIVKVWHEPEGAVGEKWDEKPSSSNPTGTLNPNYKPAKEGYYEDVTHYICQGHCPGHAVPIVDYQFIGKVENLAAFDDKPINKLYSLSTRWKHFWGEVGINFGTAAKILGHAITHQEWTEEELKELYDDATAAREEALQGSGESAWDHWDGDDVKWLQETLGDYNKDYSDGRELFKDWNIDIGALQGGYMTPAQLAEMLGCEVGDLAAMEGGRDAARTTRMLQAAAEYASSGTVYVWGGSNPKYGFDCSHFASWCTAVWEHPEADPMDLMADEGEFGYLQSQTWCDMSEPLSIPSQLKPGSIVCHRGDGKVGHVAVCLKYDPETDQYLIAESGGTQHCMNMHWYSFDKVTGTRNFSYVCNRWT